MAQWTIISSLVSSSTVTQAGLTYVATCLARQDSAFRILDLSGTIDYCDGPANLYTKCDSRTWMSGEGIRTGEWMDAYLPACDDAGDIVLFCAPFSPDVVFHARHSYRLKRADRGVTTCIGGAALSALKAEQLTILAEFFDYVLVGYDVEELLRRVSPSVAQALGSTRVIRAVTAPAFSADYSLVRLSDFVTVYSGHGCYYGRCRFCDYPARAYQKLYLRDVSDVAGDLQQIQRLRPSLEDAVLTLDCYTEQHLLATAHAIARSGGRTPYNVMLRAEQWITPYIGALLASSGCTDVFLGAEALDADILRVLRKGIGVTDIENAIRSLSPYVEVTIGLILFVPAVDGRALQSQLDCLERMLPYIHHIEPEVLTVVNGSAFARDPERFGIILNATHRVLNDSWCYGLSPDIPWSLTDPSLVELWINHADALRSMCGERVRPHYWAAVEDVWGRCNH